MAKIANVSAATVSKYLRGISVKEKNKIAIESAIKELDYQPNEFARNLRTNKSMTIGVLLPSFDNIFSTTIISHLESILMPQGYSILICASRSDSKLELAKLNFLISKKVDALIIMPVSSTPSELENSGIPTILIDRTFATTQFDCVLVNNESAAYKATTEFIMHGHSKIGIICGGASVYTTIKRLSGYKKAFTDNDLAINEDYIIFGDYSQNSGYNAVCKLMSMNQPPTAIFATNFETTTGSVIALNDLNYSIPKDISFIGFDNINAAKIYRPNLSVITQPLMEMAGALADLLLERLSGVTGVKTIILNSEFINNHSVKRLDTK